MTAPLPTDQKIKKLLLGQLCARARADLETLQRSHQDATDGITHEDARQESDKDMRSTEASYVARGQAKRVVELQQALTALELLALREFRPGDPIALGAIVRVDLGTEEVEYFVAPAAGGLLLTCSGRTFRIVTPQSPLGRELLGRTLNDEVSWSTPHGDMEGVVTSIA